MVMLFAATLLTAGGKQSKSKDFDIHPDEAFWFGIVPVMIASALSGFASTICQWVVQVGGGAVYVTKNNAKTEMEMNVSWQGVVDKVAVCVRTYLDDRAHS